VFTADRWQNSKQGTDTLSISRDTANADGVVGACAACTFTLGSGTNSALLQYLTLGTEYTDLRGRTVSLSIRVKTSTASAVKAFLQVDGTRTDGTIHSGGGVYQTLTCTVTIPTGAAVLYYGAMFTASCTAYVDNAMLVVGSVAADYAPLHPVDDLARCLRYYELLLGASLTAWTPGAVFSTTLFYTTMALLAQKAVTPTVTFSAPGNFAVQHGAGTTTAATSITTLPAYDSKRAVGINIGSSGLTQGGGIMLTTAGQSASVQIEANP